MGEAVARFNQRSEDLDRTVLAASNALIMSACCLQRGVTLAGREAPVVIGRRLALVQRRFREPSGRRLFAGPTIGVSGIQLWVGESVERAG